MLKAPFSVHFLKFVQFYTVQSFQLSIFLSNLSQNISLHISCRKPLDSTLSWLRITINIGCIRMDGKGVGNWMEWMVLLALSALPSLLVQSVRVRSRSPRASPSRMVAPRACHSLTQPSTDRSASEAKAAWILSSLQNTPIMEPGNIFLTFYFETLTCCKIFSTYSTIP